MDFRSAVAPSLAGRQADTAKTDISWRQIASHGIFTSKWIVAGCGRHFHRLRVDGQRRVVVKWIVGFPERIHCRGAVEIPDYLMDDTMKDPDLTDSEPNQQEPEYYSPSESYPRGTWGLFLDIVRCIVLSPWYLVKFAWLLVCIWSGATTARPGEVFYGYVILWLMLWLFFGFLDWVESPSPH
jgi:hypothetical protein